MTLIRTYSCREEKNYFNQTVACESLITRAISQADALLGNVMKKSRFWQDHAQTGLNDRQRKVVNHLLEAGPGGFEGGLTNRKYAGIALVSRATAQRELADLVQKGVLVANPGRLIVLTNEATLIKI